MMDVPSRFKQISEWLEENDDYGDMQLHKNDETGIALLYICNPSKRNALTGKIMSKFSKLIGELEAWKEVRIDDDEFDIVAYSLNTTH